MQYGTAVWLDTLLDLLAARLVSRAGLPADRVFESLASDQDHCNNPPADQFVTILPTAFPADQPTFAGSGRYLPGFNGQVRVAAFCRFASDQEMRSPRLLKDKTRGVLGLVKKIIDALWGWDLPTAAGASTSYLREPMRLVNFAIAPKSVKDGSPWIVVPTVWDVKFSLDISSAVP